MPSLLGAGLLAALACAAMPTLAGSSGAGSSNKNAAGPPQVAKGRLYAVVLGPGPAWKKGQPFKGPGLDQHRRYWQGLYGEGRVASAGPLGDRSGLALVRARNQREADALIAADPAVKARLLSEVARPYAPDLVSAAVLLGR